MRVANSDWWASRSVVSVSAIACCARSAAANVDGPTSSSLWRDPAGGAPFGGAGSFARGSPRARSWRGSWLTVTSARRLSSRLARSPPGPAAERSGRSSTNVVWVCPARTSGSLSSASRKPWLVLTPRTRSSATARRARDTALCRSRPRAEIFTSSGSKNGETSAPTKAEPSSSRTPAPPASGTQ